jgi:hypothetical protein
MDGSLPILLPAHAWDMREMSRVADMQHRHMLDDRYSSELTVQSDDYTRRVAEAYEAQKLLGVLQQNIDTRKRSREEAAAAARACWYAADALLWLDTRAFEPHTAVLASLCSSTQDATPASAPGLASDRELAKELTRRHSECLATCRRVGAVLLGRSHSTLRLDMRTEVLGLLVDRLGDDDASVRHAAATALDACPPEAIAPHVYKLAGELRGGTLFNGVLASTDEHARRAAVATLRRLDAASLSHVAPELVHVMNSDCAPDLRHAARAMLGRTQLVGTRSFHTAGLADQHWAGMHERDRPYRTYDGDWVEEFPTRVVR